MVSSTTEDIVAVGPPSATAILNLQPMRVEEPPQAQPTRSNLAKWAILMALYLSELIAALDTTITATSVPHICADLHSSSGYLWIGGAYVLADAAGTPIWAKLSDIWGRKPVLMVAVALFTIGSMFSATSVNMAMLIAGRAIQGTAGGGIVSLNSIIIADMFSVRERSLYLGILEFVWAVAGASGPIMGGVFTQLLTWRYNFWINLPICGISFFIIFFFLKLHNPRTSFKSGIVAIDWFGTLSILAVTLMVLLGLDFGGAVYPWGSPKVIVLIVLGIASIGLFIVSEKKLAKYPLMPLHIFKNRSSLAVFAVVVCHGMAQLGTEYYVPLYFQSVRGVSPLRSGVLVLPLIILTASGAALSGFLIHRTGRYREIICGGMLLFTLGLGLFIKLDMHTQLGEIIGFEVLEGLGAGLVFQPPLIAVQAAVRQADAASATATLGFMRNVASALGLVLGGVVFQNGMDTRIPLLRAAGLNESLIHEFSSSNAAASVERIHSIADKLQQDAVRDAYSWSLRNTWITFMAFGALGLVISVFIQHRELSRDHTETRTGIDGMSKRE